jgi:hypothetical protein
MATEAQIIARTEKPGGIKYSVQEQFKVPGQFIVPVGYILIECNDGFYSIQESIDADRRSIRLGPLVMADIMQKLTRLSPAE